ncbi:HET-domain-containing protein [Eremomyces bilateralis CBS 781.70]|uniref:HET-domain-containing protein n=1 Tax=Eremomyces bilateralis CBS 781.70 TaxID=1392243 RepID=A0A6G1G6F8_9PEZI|nr:HET-domain-containing protein [Eremomyces bilateralis CBS 781.70]KAF1813614.1 HET-domain-containing protein [Eremomyces bilateralis CBS 781.70]
MRLLVIDSDGELRLINRVGDNIPEYAILSHTWGADDEEVTFKDVINKTGINKPGYKKLLFCGKQAEKDGLLFFWVDSCCIDRSSSAELSTAINSMFRWYREAARCYVYLSDVPNPKDPTSTAESAFLNSRWFMRGWTLQELLAPSSVQFFSYKGEPLGDKKSREQQVHQITGIAIDALRGNPMSEFSIADRLSWAARRETTIGEDAAYCLLGIFEIYIPLIYGEGRNNALDRLQRKIRKFSNPASLIPAGAPWIVPFERNPHFTGRESQLAQLEGKLFAKDRTMKIAVTGLGGVGKTQLVLELLFRTKEKFQNCSIIWIPATNMENLHQAYVHVARQLGIPGWEQEQRDVKKLVQEYLSIDNASQWLLVFDNADDLDMWITKTIPREEPEQELSRLIDYLPSSKQGSIIFTTRDRKTAVKLAPQNIVEVTEMDEEIAMQLLRKSLANKDHLGRGPDTTDLLAKLMYLPLAIIQAAAYINENGTSITEYLSVLKGQEEDTIDILSEDFEDAGRYHNVKNPVATTWLISFEQIRRRDALAADYLSFMACVEPKDIPLSLFPPGLSRKKEMDAIGTLYAYSFISRRPADLAVDVHRLVHLSTRNWLRNEGILVRSMEKAISRLEEVFPDADHKNRSIWRTYLPHTRYVLESDLVDRNWKDRTDLLWRYGTCLYEDGRWNEAEGPFTQVLEMKKRLLGLEHPDTLTSMANLASTYRNQGRWDAAEELEVQVMETRKKKLGADHPHTLSSMANLASTYWNQGRWDAAEELEVQVMETRKKKLGADHPDTLSSLANLASTYWKQGRWDAAEELDAQVMETRRKKLGADHPDTLTSMANLASTYWNQGRWDVTEELEVQVMETRKKKLGADHPHTLSSMANLAITWKGTGRDLDAIHLMEQCIMLRKHVLGVDHAYTRSSSAILMQWQTEQLDIGTSAAKDGECDDKVDQ